MQPVWTYVWVCDGFQTNFIKKFCINSSTELHIFMDFDYVISFYVGLYIIVFVLLS